VDVFHQVIGQLACADIQCALGRTDIVRNSEVGGQPFEFAQMGSMVIMFGQQDSDRLADCRATTSAHQGEQHLLLLVLDSALINLDHAA
jgi:hypothetical protein